MSEIVFLPSFDVVNGILTKHGKKNVEALPEEQRQIHSARYANFNTYIGSMSPGNINLAAGRPGMGKTSLALRAMAEALDKKLNIYFISFVHSPEDLVLRIALLGCKAPDLPGVLAGKSSFRMYPNVKWWFSNLANASLHFAKIEPKDLESALALVPDGAALFIDGYQELYPLGAESASVEALDRAIIEAAKRMDFIYITAGVKRTVENRKDHVPQLKDLRVGKTLLDACTTIQILYREGYYSCNEDERAFIRNYTEKELAGDTTLMFTRRYLWFSAVYRCAEPWIRCQCGNWVYWREDKRVNFDSQICPHCKKNIF